MDFLQTFHVAPLVVTCKNRLVPRVNQVCLEVLGKEPILYNVGHRPSRDETFMLLLDEAKQAVDAGRDAIFHCHAGVHRAALTTITVMMFGLGIRLSEAVAKLSAVRRIKWEDATNGTRRSDGSCRENHMKYLPAWEEQALTLPHHADIRFLPPLPRVIAPTMDLEWMPEIVELGDDDADADEAKEEDAEYSADKETKSAEALPEPSSSSAQASRPTEVIAKGRREVPSVAVTGPSGVERSMLIAKLLAYYNTPLAEVEMFR